MASAMAPRVAQASLPNLISFETRHPQCTSTTARAAPCTRCAVCVLCVRVCGCVLRRGVLFEEEERPFNRRETECYFNRQQTAGVFNQYVHVCRYMHICRYIYAYILHMILDVDTDQRSQVTKTRRPRQEGAELMRLTGERVCAH